MNFSMSKGDKVMLVILILCALVNFAMFMLNKANTISPEAPAFDVVVNDPAYDGFMLVFDDKLPGDSDPDVVTLKDPRLDAGPRDFFDKLFPWIKKILISLFWLYVFISLIKNARFLLIFNFIINIFQGKSIRDSLLGAICIVVGLPVFVFFLIFYALRTTIDDVKNKTLDKYEESAYSFYRYQGNVGVDLFALTVSINAKEYTDSNAYTHKYIENVVVDVGVDNVLSVPIMAGSAKCILNVSGRLQQYIFPIYPKTGESHPFEYLFIPEKTSGAYVGEFELNSGKGNVREDSVKVIGCAVVDLMAYKNVLINDENKQKQVEARYESGFLRFTNHTDRAVREASVKCEHLLQPSGSIRENTSSSSYKSSYYTIKMDSQALPLRARNTERYSIDESMPMYCVTSSYESY